MKLNEQQQAAVDCISGSLLILAGAGTGKTRVIVQRIGNMVSKGIPGSSILAVTFTNKAAREMQERVLQLDGINPKQAPTIATFHSFCAEILRSNAHHLGYTKNFTLAQEGYQKGLLRQIAVELGLDKDNIDPYSWLATISLAKANMKSPEDMAQESFKEAERISRIYRRYQELMLRMNMMDFDDLLNNTVKLWQENPDILAAHQKQYRYLMIDEYQDTNKVQLQLMVLLAGESQNICAVGDDDQSIYAWRGANHENILQFEQYFPKAQTIRLEQNYRSTNAILKAANAVIVRNKARHPKALWSSQKGGELPVCVHCESGAEEATFVADAINSMALEGRSVLSREREWSQFAILFRTGGQAQALEAAFKKRGIPYVIRGSKSFYQQKEILDIITLLELACNPKNDMAFHRIANVPPRGLTDSVQDRLDSMRATMKKPQLALLDNMEFLATLPQPVQEAALSFKAAILKCGNGADQPGCVLQKVQTLLEDIQYIPGLIKMYHPREDALKRKDNVNDFLATAANYDLRNAYKGTLQDFCSQLALDDGSAPWDKDEELRENAVTFMTMHGSKGLEFPTVFVVGMEQGLFPHLRAIEEGSLEEERRLCYVAMTRAKKKLFMTFADRRKVMQHISIRRPSMFLDEVPAELMELKKPNEIIVASPAQSAMSMEEIKKHFGIV